MAAIMLVAITTQTVSGFGTALIAVPLMSLVIDLRTAVVAIAFLATGVAVAQVAHEHGHLERRLASRVALSAVAGLPIGVIVLRVVSERILQAVLGAVVVVATVLLTRRVEPRVPDRADLVAGMTSGVLSTSIGTNGPPIVLLFRARRLSPPVFRATISAVFLSSGALSLIAFGVGGLITGDALVAAAAGLPATVLGWVIGARLKPRVRPESFQQMVIALLLVSAASALVAAVRG